MENMVVSG